MNLSSFRLYKYINYGGKYICNFIFTGSMNPSEVADGLGLTKMTNRKWYIHGASAIYFYITGIACLLSHLKQNANGALCLRSYDGSCATTGEGIYESMKEMADLVKNSKHY
jgi:hypothetical protein